MVVSGLMKYCPRIRTWRSAVPAAEVKSAGSASEEVWRVPKPPSRISRLVWLWIGNEAYIIAKWVAECDQSGMTMTWWTSDDVHQPRRAEWRPYKKENAMSGHRSKSTDGSFKDCWFSSSAVVSAWPGNSGTPSRQASMESVQQKFGNATVDADCRMMTPHLQTFSMRPSLLPLVLNSIRQGDLNRGALSCSVVLVTENWNRYRGM